MSTQMAFKKAERKQHKLKLALTGVSGSGKTYSALAIATGLVNKGLATRIAVIDTENGTATLYADKFQFDHLDIKPPYTVEKYNAALNLAQKEGYDVAIVDSLSHAWAGDGGLLMQKEQLDARGGKQNQYANWAPITKQHEQFKSKILNYDGHLICTMRSKQDYALSEDNGKKSVIKLGLAPIQRDGIEYEFTTVIDLAIDHTASVSKDRTGLFDGQIFTPSIETGRRFIEWLNRGWKAGPTERNRIKAICDQYGLNGKDVSSLLATYRKTGVSELNRDEYEELLTFLNKAKENKSSIDVAKIKAEAIQEHEESQTEELIDGLYALQKEKESEGPSFAEFV